MNLTRNQTIIAALSLCIFIALPWPAKLAATIGSAGLLAASTTPSYRPMTDNAQSRIVLSMAITLMVMCCPACAAGAAYSVAMFLVGSAFMFGVMQLALGSTPHRRLSPVLIDARPPRGYRWVPNCDMRLAEVMA